MRTEEGVIKGHASSFGSDGGMFIIMIALMLSGVYVQLKTYQNVCLIYVCSLSYVNYTTINLLSCIYRNTKKNKRPESGELDKSDPSVIRFLKMYTLF